MFFHQFWIVLVDSWSSSYSPRFFILFSTNFNFIFVNSVFFFYFSSSSNSLCLLLIDFSSCFLPIFSFLHRFFTWNYYISSNLRAFLVNFGCSGWFFIIFLFPFLLIKFSFYSHLFSTVFVNSSSPSSHFPLHLVSSYLPVVLVNFGLPSLIVFTFLFPSVLRLVLNKASFYSSQLWLLFVDSS